MSFLTKIFGDPNAKVIKEIQPIVDKINSLESDLKALSDEALKAKTAEFKDRLSKGETLNDILPESFAVVREASRRATGMRHFDVQLIGGVALHRGQISEMRTGEGKTLVATLPIYLNALAGKGVHLVTVNDYLAKRDAVWMGKIYDFLGMSVGIIQQLGASFKYRSALANAPTSPSPSPRAGEGATDADATVIGKIKVGDEEVEQCTRREAYACDITYGTNNEFGFDYLRDNMAPSLSEMVQRPFYYAIVDEVDSILVDEARTPLIISAPAEEAADLYYKFADLVKRLKENEDFNIDEKMRSSTLTDAGLKKMEDWLGIGNIYAEGGMTMVHHVEQALRAHALFKRDRDYVVDNGEVVIVDEFTGRKMPGRRYSEGLHQAIEAQEGVKIQRESRTLATVTFQNYFRLYEKLSGMTGTAVTEAEEFGKIYNLEVVVIPTNHPNKRADRPDRIYRTEEAKWQAIAKEVKELQTKGQPVLIGTISVEKNEALSLYLDREGIKHEILNPKNHEREGEIIAQAGRPGAVTLATNMAGRGVDIKLGGVPAIPEDIEKVKQAGGLFVLGTERHESRRIDNQLRGRAARQGDPGETQFFVSTDDDLMRIFAGDRMKSVMTRFNVPEDMPIEQKIITRMIEGTQKKVEGFHFDTRKHLLEYDDVLNKHREVIYKRRRKILDLSTNYGKIGIGDNGQVKRDDAGYNSLKEMILNLIEQEIEFVVSYHTNPEDRQEWNLKEICETINTIFTLSSVEREEIMKMVASGGTKLNDVEGRDKMVNYLLEKARKEYLLIEQKILQFAGGNDAEGQRIMREIEKSILLRAIDSLWVDHLVDVDYLRTGIGLRGYGQRDPLVEYKKETYFMFNSLLSAIQKEIVYSFYKVGTGIQLAPSVMANDKMVLKGAQKTAEEIAPVSSKPRDEGGHKIGRNDSCPCGSGKKYKKCHGA